MSDALRMRALFGDGTPPATKRGLALWRCRRLRALRSWIKPGCYGWWRLTDDLKAEQRRLLALRPGRATGEAAQCPTA